MKKRWFISLFASIPVVAAVLALQSCGGVGGPTAANGGGGVGGGVTAEFLALLSDEQKTAKYITPEDCAACHGGKNADDPIYKHWKDTKHAAKGVTCEKCHGPGSAHKANPTKTNILTFPKVSNPVVCAQCHGPIAQQYSISGHNQLIAAPVEEAIQNPNQYGRSSKCIACHSGVVRIEQNKGMDENPPVEVIGSFTDDVIKELCESTMNDVPHIANCATCHNPHKQTGNLNAEGEEKQLRRQTFNTDTAPIGPGSSSTSFTTFNHGCAQCHNGRGADPSDAKLKTGTARPNMHDSNQFNMLMGVAGVEEGNGPIVRNTPHSTAPGQCSKCHMPSGNHAMKVNYDVSCTPCHSAADAAARMGSTRSAIVDALLALRGRMTNWAVATFPGKAGNTLFWDYTSMITAEDPTFVPPDQTLVPIEIKRARHNYYFVIRSGDYGAHNAPYARYLITVANNNLDRLPNPPAAARPSCLDFNSKFQILKNDGKRASQADFQGLK